MAEAEAALEAVAVVMMAVTSVEDSVAGRAVVGPAGIGSSSKLRRAQLAGKEQQ